LVKGVGVAILIYLNFRNFYISEQFLKKKGFN